ncbi:hypothetical protein SLE2022_219860 [Rubroshorea leprosula]
MDENAADEIMREIDVDAACEIVKEEQEIKLVDIELEEEFNADNAAEEINKENDVSPIREVQQTVPTTDDPMLSVLTFRVWFLGMLSCVLLSLFNTFLRYCTCLGSFTIQHC